ncbi:MAG: hypothetical protein SVU32_01230 [Candidatus Nanohaloarchaea archaeon]|nr:hypothetical protein [Candidatus Nanohaloarchaea archaeon]
MTLVDTLSALFLLVAAILVFLYAREFFMERPPFEWYLVGAGTVIFAFASSIGYYRFEGIFRAVVALATMTGSIIMAFGYFRAYKRSTGGMR